MTTLRCTTQNLLITDGTEILKYIPSKMRRDKMVFVPCNGVEFFCHLVAHLLHFESQF